MSEETQIGVPLKSGKELEAELLAKEQERLVEGDPVELAAQMFTIYFPKFVYLVNKLSSRSLKRLIRSLVEYPLGQTDPKQTTPEEAEAFVIGRGLMDSKMVMIYNTYAENAAKIEAESEKQIKEMEKANGENVL